MVELEERNEAVKETFRAYHRRIEWLPCDAAEEGFSVNEGSETDLWLFVKLLPLARRGDIVLRDNGNSRIVWDSDDESHLGIQFLGSRLLEYVILLLLAAALACGPSGAEGYNRAGVEHFEAGRVEEAIAQYSEAIRLDPEFAAALYNRGQAYFTLGHFDKAVPDFTRAIDVDPTDRQVALAYAGRAMAYTMLENDAEAGRDMSRAIKGGFEAQKLIAIIKDLKAQR